ncbi:MAG: Hsp20 family protein [Acidimicrobiales bacterium]
MSSRSVLTITATGTDGGRRPGLMNERTQGTVRRQVHLGDSLDVEGIEADFSDGVLTLGFRSRRRPNPRRSRSASGTQPAIDVESDTGLICHP